MKPHIAFNRPFLTGKEAHYIYQAVYSGKLSGNGQFTKKCQNFFTEKYGFKKSLLTTSCTDALEMCALLINIKEGDEVIMPSYTFVSTANPFVLRGAKIVFADSCWNNPNIDPNTIEALITENTKAIVVVHYAGIACNMEAIMAIAHKHKLFLIEDAAQAIDSFYKGKALGSFGHLSSFSFHETKNIISGEGGLLAINDKTLIDRAEIIWEKGTNRTAFFRGEVDKYGWVDIGSSFLPSEVIAAFLYAQLENIDLIQNRRKKIWFKYYEGLKEMGLNGHFQLPTVPSYATVNGHIFYIVCNSAKMQKELLVFLNEKGVNAVFHYLSLHKSKYYYNKHDGRELKNADNYSDCLIRLPLFYDLNNDQIQYVIGQITSFFTENRD